MSEGPLNREAIERVIDEFKDPELGRGVVGLGQLQSVELAGDSLTVTLGLTTFSAPLWEAAKTELTELLKARFGQLGRVTVKLAVHERPAEKIGEVGLAAKAVIAVGSGKGGVGKSTIASVLAYGLCRTGAKVGLMDADVYGPSIPHLTGASGQPKLVDGRIRPIVVDGLAVMSMGFFIPPGEAVAWRGPMLHGAITQFLRDTEWGSLDYLIVDLPPGTGDVVLSLSQLLPLTGAVVVCTPQDVALLDAVKAMAMLAKVNVDVLGIVENMSHFICGDCGSRHEIFGSGGARRKAAELNVPFLGEVPVNVQIRIAGDEGKVASSLDDEACGPHLAAICENLVKNVVGRRREEPPMPSLSVLS